MCYNIIIKITLGGSLVAVGYPPIINEGFSGNRSSDVCKRLDKLYEQASKKEKPIASLKNTIYNLKDEDIEELKRTGSLSKAPKGGQLNDYQTYGVGYLLLTKNGILTDSTGLGKTVQISSLLNVVSEIKQKQTGKPLRFLFLTQLGLVNQAQEELIRFTAKPVLTSTGQAKDVDKLIFKIEEDGDFSGIVGSYSLVDSFKFVVWLKTFADSVGGIDYLIIDEGSVLANSTTSTYKAFSTLRDEVCKYRVILNATPFERDIMTNYSQLDFVAPEAMPTKTQFRELFVKTNFVTKAIIGYKDPDGFIQAVRYLQFGQTRAELGVSIVNSSCELVMYQMTPKQRSLLRLASSPQYVFENPTWLDKKIHYGLNTVPKAGMVYRIYQEKVFPNRMMVYCKHKEAQRGLSEVLEYYGVSTIILNGEDNTPELKTQKLKTFNEENIQVLITNLDKGLNLGYLNHLVLYTVSPSAGIMNQIEGRIVREQNIIDKHIYLPLASVKEWEVLNKLSKNAKDKADHTKIELSLLNRFLFDNKDVAVQLAKDNMNKDIGFSHVVCQYEGRETEISLSSDLLDEDEMSLFVEAGLEEDDWGDFIL